MKTLVALSLLLNAGLSVAIWHEHSSLEELRSELETAREECSASDARNFVVKDSAGQTRLELGERDGRFGLFLFDASGEQKADLAVGESAAFLGFDGDGFASYGNSGIRIIRDQLIHAELSVKPNGSTRLLFRDMSGTGRSKTKSMIQLGTIYTGGDDPLNHKPGLLISSGDFVFRTPIPPR